MSPGDNGRAGAESAYWFVRKSGWVQGPLTLDALRHMYAAGWVLAVDSVATATAGPWREARECSELRGGDHEVADAPAVGMAGAEWEFASSAVACSEAVSFAMLQMLAASGRLRPKDLVRQLPGGDWQQAQQVAGIFGGRRAWCTACGRALEGDATACSCGAPQPEYEPSLAAVSMVCGGVALLLFCGVVATVTWLAWRGSTVFDVPMAERFPAVFGVALAPVAFLAALAVAVGKITMTSIDFGRAAPSDLGAARTGFWLGTVSIVLLVLAAVAIFFYSLAFFVR